MRRAIGFSAVLALIIAAVFGGAWLQEQRPIFHSGPRPLSVAEARTLSRSDLARRGLSLLADKVVEVRGVPPENLPPNLDKSLSQLAFALEPRPGGWPGLCSAKIISLEFYTEDEAASQDENFEPVLDDVRVQTVYKVVGSLDPNRAPTQPAASDCAKGRAFADGYFYSRDDDAASASETGRLVEAVRVAANSAGPLPFRVICGPEVSCSSVRSHLASVAANAIVLSNTSVRCPDDRSCYDIILHAGGQSPTGLQIGASGAPPLRAMTVVGRYLGVGTQGQGILVVESIIIDDPTFLIDPH